MGPREEDIIAIFFDLDGYYLRYETRPRPGLHDFRLREKLTQGALESSDVQDLSRLEDEAVKTYMTDLGVTPDAILVKQFQLPEREIAVRDMPSFYKRFLDSGGHLFDDEAEDKYTHNNMEEWIERNQFVLLWGGKEYWMTEDGEVEST